MRHSLPRSPRTARGRVRPITWILLAAVVGALVAGVATPAFAAATPKLSATVTCSLAGRDTPESGDDRFRFTVRNNGSAAVTADIGSMKDHGDTPPAVRRIAPRESVTQNGNESPFVVAVDLGDAGTVIGDDPDEIIVRLDPPAAGQVPACGGSSSGSPRPGQSNELDSIKDCRTTIEALTGLKAAAAARMTAEQLRRAVQNAAARDPFTFGKKLLDLSGDVQAVNRCTQYTGGTYADLICKINNSAVVKFFTLGRYSRC